MYTYIFFIAALLFKIYCSVIVVLPFPHYSPYPAPHSHSQSSPLSVSTSPLFVLFCLCLLFLSPVISHLPHCLFVLIPKPLVLFCSFVCFVDQDPVTGEVIWYLSFTPWLISLSIMLYSSIHAVMKKQNFIQVLFRPQIFNIRKYCNIVVVSYRFNEMVNGNQINEGNIIDEILHTDLFYSRLINNGAFFFHLPKLHFPYKIF